MSDQVWYVFQNGEQLGPFSGQQIRQMVTSKMIPQGAYLFKVGWKDWRPIEETLDEIGVEASVLPPPAVGKGESREAAPRATIGGRVVVHNNGQLVIGSGANISATGIFVETKDQLFTVGEKLKLSVRIDSFARPFNVVAKVIRYNSDPRYPIGYGLKFEDLDEAVAREIQGAVDAANRANAGQKLAR